MCSVIRGSGWCCGDAADIRYGVGKSAAHYEYYSTPALLREQRPLSEQHKVLFLHLLEEGAELAAQPASATGTPPPPPTPGGISV